MSSGTKVQECNKKATGGPECLSWGLVRGPHENTEGQAPSLSDPSFSDPSLFSPVDEMDSFGAKAILTTLIILDKASFISPFRWFLPTASLDGRHLESGALMGCTDDHLRKLPEQIPDASSVQENPPQIGCTKDVDCREPRICEGGECVDPSPLPPDPVVDAGPSGCTKDIDCREPRICEGGECVFPPEPTPEPTPDAGSPPELDAGQPTLPPECEENEIRICGPCNVGRQQCGQDGIWESSCHYLENQLQRACYNGPPATEGIAQCRAGTQQCVDGLWGPCENQTLPQPESCDGQDNDCDGWVDAASCFRKIGDPCYPNARNNTSPPLLSDDCDSGKCISPTLYSGGYCTTDIFYYFESPGLPHSEEECLPGHNFRKAVCVNSSQLGVDTNYYDWWHSSRFFCVVTCETNLDCRTNEGYLCKAIIGSAFKACLPQYEEVTIGEGPCAH
ncbi:MAG: hypothetical protein A3F82_06960 [Deltaproteobacteria bacterium RIFCSPLOWO2_12_FULL_44_12]|nr:MAG: hypothetical protein A2712_09795 [Deltaproteobacteria bacterium RIFCSPHIGHO2_01_FULL_43_49]OGQ15405.1 MAG: hypothetical protein A3D22_10325 [Deltaproteobacteria bacterium RIFCSPHIGHO2_02_FULL_44_53]OGQ29599.1 MAG: hypothetical protein A3D98_10525 [Deltaproteobacteria bacterium RIFCSPHIGHO2_12_FULL_44_21]OGQ32212.1 MAG: hypothetical protein A2979_00170 [Deltaproteobacteria bacterium RIFCSPLOWO2_01_FULL_45_74]OGQ43853.1 MAG: hypothetical protein A3I70_04065 [Deltaproteobacteria bacterium 